jgi:hypothetical protein
VWVGYSNLVVLMVQSAEESSYMPVSLGGDRKQKWRTFVRTHSAAIVAVGSSKGTVELTARTLSSIVLQHCCNSARQIVLPESVVFGRRMPIRRRASACPTTRLVASRNYPGASLPIGFSRLPAPWRDCLWPQPRSAAK